MCAASSASEPASAGQRERVVPGRAPAGVSADEKLDDDKEQVCADERPCEKGRTTSETEVDGRAGEFPRVVGEKGDTQQWCAAAARAAAQRGPHALAAALPPPPRHRSRRHRVMRVCACVRSPRHAHRMNLVACSRPLICCLTPPAPPAPPSASPAPSRPCAARNRCGCSTASAFTRSSAALSRL